MKIRIAISICALILVSSESFSRQPSSYAVDNIPESLKKNANSVIRKKEYVLTIYSKTKAELTVSYAVTILREAAKREAYFAAFYDKFSKIKNIKASVYNEAGKEVKSLKKSDILDASIIQGIEFFDDNRVKAGRADYYTYPFTFEYSYEMDLNGSLNYPSFQLYEGYNQSVEYAHFKVTSTPEVPVRYFERNGCPQANSTGGSNQNTFVWNFSNQPAVTWELFSPNLSAFTPSVLIAPNNFEVAGYEGNAENWDNFANWISKLNAGRDNLSPETKSELKNLVQGISDPEEKAKVLYEYMQNKTRYVNISLGIGGWQPFEADFVDRQGYGDCKALSFYMKSILDAVGINSNYVLVKSGRNSEDMLPEFPSNQFNHAFLFVPFEKDTVWLECTSQMVPFGYIGTFTDDRHVLLIEDDGNGKIVNTPSYSLSDNIRTRKASVLLDENLTGFGDLSSTYKGVLYDDIYANLQLNDTEVKERLYKSFNINGLEILNFAYSEKRNQIPEINEDIKLVLKNYASKSGSKVFITPDVFSRSLQPNRSFTERKAPVYIKRPLQTYDTLYFKLPENLKLNKLPEAQELTSKYGRYFFNMEFADHTLKYIRHFELYSGSYPATEFSEMEKFFTSIYNMDQEKAVFEEL